MTLGNTGLKVYPSWVILEKINPQEWVSLTDYNKQVFQLVISAGHVCLSEGGSMRQVLIDMFPEETATGIALRLL
jgi:hypothetical protein